MTYLIFTLIVISSMGVALAFVRNSEVLNSEEKRKFTLFILLSMYGVSGDLISFICNTFNIMQMIDMHKFIKTSDFILAPLIAWVFADFFDNNEKIKKFLEVLFWINGVIEVISAFTGCTFYIDERNVYHHGPLYIFYIFVYIISIASTFVSMCNFYRELQAKNFATLIAIYLEVAIAVIIQINFPHLKVDWMVINIVFIIFLLYYCELVLKLDNLTKLLNRMCFDNRANRINYDTAVIFIDVNDFKTINDTYGHYAGDVCLVAIAEAIKNAYSKIGYCYRYGGDEFVVVLKKGVLKTLTTKKNNFDKYKAINDIDEYLEEELKKKRENIEFLPSVSSGFGIYNCGDCFQEVLSIADKRMYEKKKNSKNNM